MCKSKQAILVLMLGVVVCCVLKGGHQYFADLVDEIKKLRRINGTSVQLSLEFIRVKSYMNDTSSGGVKISLTDAELQEFKGKVKKKNRVGRINIVCSNACLGRIS